MMNISNVGNGSDALFPQRQAPVPTVSRAPASTGNVSADSSADAVLPHESSTQTVPGTNAMSEARNNPNDPNNRGALEQEMQKSAEALNDFIKPYAANLHFSVDQDINRVIIKVTDLETSEVIRQIPSEEAVAITKALDTLKGLLVRQQA